MGILDDAIREHLELKRRRGTDPNEIERLEREALGPVRRGPREGYDAPAAEDAVQDAEYQDEEPGDAELFSSGDDPAPAWSSSRDEPVEAWSPPRDEPPFIDHGSELTDVDVEEWESPERGPVQGGIPIEPDIAAPATPAPPYPGEAPPASGPLDESHHLEQETAEHDVEAEHAEEAERDDMLEETPEFLQDTPDHDRLWFEQRPPRDFDFDG